jgi:glyoxylase-like metal-dependent hydrolase (beta-lactamase superfamily II)
MALDGGAMWGVVPKALWNKLTPANDDNTIRLALRPFLAERGDVKLVIEVGIGDRWDDKFRKIYAVDQSTNLAGSLRAVGIEPEDVTHVVASHCHFDHIGAQVVARDGELLPLFPNARHFAPKVEVEICVKPDHVRRASYRPDDIQAIIDAGLLETYEGVEELLPGVKVHQADGHSDGVSVVTINEEAEGETAIFWADVVPTTHHIQPAYIMAYDINAVRSFEHRSHWLQRASEGGWIGLFYHDVDHAFARITKDGRRYRCGVVEGEARG